MNRLVFCTVMVLTCMLLGCGKKGDPSPPEFFAPASVAALLATPKAEGVLLSWDAPSETVRGERLIDLASFEIRRGVFVKGETTRFQDLATVPMKVDAQTGAVVKSYTFRDATAELGKTYEYRVFAFNEDGVSTGVGASIRVAYSGEAGVIPGQ